MECDKTTPADELREAEIAAGINGGLNDMFAGRLVPHDEAMAELDAAIERVVAE